MTRFGWENWGDSRTLGLKIINHGKAQNPLLKNVVFFITKVFLEVRIGFKIFRKIF